MGPILIDKLLSAQVKQGASDLHISVGQPPVLRLHGHLQKLKTKVLEPADTIGRMKSIKEGDRTMLDNTIAAAKASGARNDAISPSRRP